MKFQNVLERCFPGLFQKDLWQHIKYAVVQNHTTSIENRTKIICGNLKGKDVTKNLGWVAYFIWAMDLPVTFLEVKA